MINILILWTKLGADMIYTVITKKTPELSYDNRNTHSGEALLEIFRKDN